MAMRCVAIDGYDLVGPALKRSKNGTIKEIDEWISVPQQRCLGTLLLEGSTIDVPQEPMAVVSVSVLVHSRRSQNLLLPSFSQNPSGAAVSQPLPVHSNHGSGSCCPEEARTLAVMLFA